MAKTFKVQVTIKNQKPLKVYRALLDSEKHSEICGIKTKIDLEKLTFKSGDVSGKLINLLNGKQIIMTYKCKAWDKSIQPSIVSLCFTLVGDDTLLEIFHSNVEDEFVDSMKRGWKEKYVNVLKKL